MVVSLPSRHNVYAYPYGVSALRELNRWQPIVLSVLGDSHSSAGSTTRPEFGSWVGAMVYHTGGGVGLYRNHSVSGAGLEGGTVNAEAQMAALLADPFLPDIVVMAIGANNRTSDTPSNMLVKYRSVCDSLRARLIAQRRPGLLFHRTPLPTRTTDPALRQSENNWNWAVRDGMRGYAEQNGDLWFDPYTTPGLTEGAAGNPIGVASLFGDQYHPNAEGNDLIGYAAAPVLRTVLAYPHGVLPPAYTPTGRVPAPANTGTSHNIDARDGNNTNQIFRHGGVFLAANATRPTLAGQPNLDRFSAAWFADAARHTFAFNSTTQVPSWQYVAGAVPLTNQFIAEVREGVATVDYDVVSPGDWLFLDIRLRINGLEASGGDIRIVEQFWQSAALSGSNTTFTPYLRRASTVGAWDSVSYFVQVPADRRSLQLFVGNTALTAGNGGTVELHRVSGWNMTRMGRLSL